MRRCSRWIWLFLIVLSALPVRAASLADGFSRLPAGAVVLLMPLDIELFSVSAGGILEPQAAWPDKAHANLRQAFLTRSSALQINFMPLPGAVDDVVERLNRLHGAVGQAIALHHRGAFALPTKEGRLDWSLGEEAALLRERTGADYALFAFVRDSYASNERVAMMVVGLLLGVGLGGGMQVGYASLVDLSTGRVVWFNTLLRASGDLREPEKARESCDALLDKFPE